MFRKSPAWDESLDALIINGTRTHDPDYHRIWELGIQILHKPLCTTANYERIYQAIRFFSHREDDIERGSFIEAINEIAPKAYAPGKKPSRIFKAICEALGVADNTAGSEFQRLYAQFADELSSRKISFKLFVSLNPAHFITMSNPKNDERGGMLTSCHSFNSTEYDYNCGCTGYARDNVTMIAFTVTDPDNPETLNNRKTTRQLYMYRPGNGLLLQSRMYNSAGGTHGAQAESKVYRDLIQREISECEAVPNLWRTVKYIGGNLNVRLYTAKGFGGYPDWEYSEFAAMISIRADHEQDFRPFEIGNWGLCICCGDEIDSKLYCSDCGYDDHCDSHCDDCECECDEDDLWPVYDRYGNVRHVCEDCRRDSYSRCAYCDEYYETGVEEVGGGEWVCESCREQHYTRCEECDELHRTSDMHSAVDNDGNSIKICESCRDQYYVKCDDCGRYVHTDNAEPAHKHGREVTVCPDCRDSHYTICDGCCETYHDDDLLDCTDGCYCDKCKVGKVDAETGEIIKEADVA